MNHLTYRLRDFADLSQSDCDVLDRLSETNRTVFERGSSVVSEGEPVENWHVFYDGWAYHSKQLENGDRQIVGLVIPGDICGLNPAIVQRADHTVTALTRCEVSVIDRKTMKRTLETSSSIDRAMQVATFEIEAIQREWTTNVGHRNAVEGMAHLICEMHFRLRQAKVIDGDRFALPLTQQLIGDCLAISVVHANRTLSELRRLGLIAVSGGAIIILDLDGLYEAGHFDPSYLNIS
ncbi:Crp/Fnr family transcriptional regulator [Pararhizobium haloflavum]|uniref:Crp/Fnr family transcriptional regulator n=1 Tax=Pararhizobium haloflavum TaxID=2037914 RepID=UPI000C18221A|nr:Crp/Fnr family transcriptional regulator [Pararhizobium haloflavum]